MTNVLMIIKIEPNIVKILGTSLNIRYPNIIAKIKFKYLIGVTSETSELL